MLGALLCFIAMAGFAETPYDKARADFKKVNRLYASTVSYSLDIQYLVFDNHTAGNMVEQKAGKYVKSGERSYMQVLNTETIINKERTIVMNHEDKFILISDTKPLQISPLQTNVDTMLKWCSSIRVKETGSAERQYTLFFSEKEEIEFSKIEVVINLNDYSIRKLVLCYNQEMPLDENDYYAKEKKPRLEIVYKAFKPATSVNTALFTESTYVSYTNSTYKGIGKYAAYEVINQLQSVRFKKK